MKKIIIVIPVFNVEKYLEELRLSLENQSEKDFTVILVNDGSTDNSASFLKRWAKQDKRLVFIEKENGGLGSARNAALDWIKTNYQSDAYILFLDSDDLFETTMVEHVMKQANKLNVDILEFEGYPIFETPKLEAEHPTLAGWMSMNGDYSKPLPGPEYLKRSGVADTKSCAWLRAYIKEYLLEQNLRFPEGILHEDVFFAFASVFRAKQVACLHEKLYIYRIRPASITTKERSWENIKGRYYAILEGIKELNKHPELDEEQRAALTSVCLLYTSPSPRDGATSRMPSSA